MLTRRDTLKIVAISAGALALGGSMALAQDSKLDWAFFQASEAGFRRTPILLTGANDAVLLDGGFTLPDGRALADAIKATGKNLTTIFISCNDPDYYFSLRPVVDAFPDAKVIARPATVEAIKANVQGKLDAWGPQLGENGPQVLADVVIPEPTDATALDLEGHAIEIVEFPEMHDRRYLWVPSLKAVFGGVLVYSGIHVWMADAAKAEDRDRWIAALDGLIARAPEVLVPGHQAEGAAQGLDAVRFTRDYLMAFNEEDARTKDSAELIAAMVARYPDLPDVGSLELGAKVVKGEMDWG